MYLFFLDIDGTKMCVMLLTDGSFSVRAAEADENSPTPAPAVTAKGEVIPQAKNPRYQKLVINLAGAAHRTVAVWFYPLTDGREIPADAPELKPLALW